MSQIDEQFLNALPLSLRQQISSTINCNNLMNEKTIKTSNVTTINEKSMNQKKNYNLKNKKKLKSSPKKSIIWSTRQNIQRTKRYETLLSSVFSLLT
jgi:hypothetical protein